MILATLLYIQNDKGEYLLMERQKNPNKGLISPPGGKVETASAESPVHCAVREAMEECGINSVSSDWKLAGIVTENKYPHIGNVMIFLMKYKPRISEIPADCIEGNFLFIHPDQFNSHNIPETDKKFIWSRIYEDKDEPFFISLDCAGFPEIKEII
ncbi:MAG TPA: NUDIX domain-containing protein [Ignavibacteria bacterium]|nr:NUDIX hydrolase [Bacteroidota bacterium]HRI83860.1 NUDIX domain-containing protein [Ignavibacteria bacterium]HRJ99893.1 NUDIX domain-containing protein [Ignavibacteria bacterium]